MMVSILGNKDMENPTGYKRWLVGIIISLFGTFGTVLYATYATGQHANQIQTNTLNIETLQQRSYNSATKEDINRLEGKIDELMKREMDRKR
jgi:hypothetical protein